jgi:putative heme iron utilization protein
MQLAAAEDKKTDAEIERELLERFGMSNVETDAYVKETVEEFLHRTQGALLSMDSEALFVRVNRAHLRFAAKGK